MGLNSGGVSVCSLVKVEVSEEGIVNERGKSREVKGGSGGDWVEMVS